jgi:hypothetical protein
VCAGLLPAGSPKAINAFPRQIKSVITAQIALYVKELKKKRSTIAKTHALWYPGQRIFIVDIDDVSSILHKFVGGRLVEKPY